MPKSRTNVCICVFALAVALTACSDPQPPTMTAADVEQNLDSLQVETTAVLSAASLAELSGLLDGIDTSGLASAGGVLPRGAFEYDSATDTWTLVEPSDDLELRWVVEATGEDAVLVVDWDASAETAVRPLPGDVDQELPQGASLVLSLDGVVVADFDQSATWPVNACGYLTEPGTFYVSGTVESADTTLTVDQTGIATTASGDSLDVESQGGLEVASAAGRAWLDWTLGLDLTVTRDDTTCVLVDGEVESGHVSVDFGVQTPTEDASVGFATNFAINLPEAPGEATTLTLTGGRLTFDGVLAVTWNGVLDDENGNGVPGENLLLTFADGSMSLEEFLQEHYAALAFGARVAKALR